MPDDDQSLGGEQTFSGKAERDDSPESIGDEGTYAGGPGVRDPKSLGDQSTFGDADGDVESFDGRCIRLLTIVDHFTRESLGIVVGQRLRGSDVADALNRIGFDRPWPKTIRVDNGPEFTSKILDQWAYASKVTLDFSRPGKPTDNAFIESFNGRIRAECLNENWFLSIDDARQKIEAWRQDYNNHRPHSALGNLAPGEFAQSGQAIAD